MGRPARWISSRATLLLGNRTATVSCPAVTTSGMMEDLGTIRVMGPGQKAAISFFAMGERPLVSGSISSISLMCRVSGLSAGRPLAA